MHCQSCGLPISPTTEICPRCKQPVAPAPQSAQNQHLKGNLPSTEPFSWQNNSQNAAQQPPPYWNNGNPTLMTNAAQAPFGQQPPINSEPIHMYPSPATNFPPNQSQGAYQNIPYRTPGPPYSQMAGNQQPMAPQGPGQPPAQNYAQMSMPQTPGPLYTQSLMNGPFPPTSMQSGPIPQQPQAFQGGSFPPGPMQPQAFNGAPFPPPMQTSPVQPQAFQGASFPPGPIQPQAFNGASFPPPPMQTSPVRPQAFQGGSFPPGPVQPQAFNGASFPPPPMQTSPVRPQAFFQGGSFPSGPMQSSLIQQSQPFNGASFPYAPGGSVPFQIAKEQIIQHSPVGTIRSAGLIKANRTSSMRQILIKAGAGFIIVLLAAVGYFAFLQKNTTPQVTLPVKQIAQTHTKKLPPLPPITISDPQALYTQATGRVAIINDPLHIQSDNDWETANSPGNCTFDGNTLHTVDSSADPRTTMCIANATKYKNIAFQAQLTIIKGDTYGLIMRADSKGQKLYLFGITTTGMYTLAVTDGQNGTQQHILAAGTSAAIKQGLNQSNQLTIIARDNTLYLYINQKFITKVDDTTAASGSIGVFEGNSQSDVSEARFSDVKVWSV